MSFRVKVAFFLLIISITTNNLYSQKKKKPSEIQKLRKEIQELKTRIQTLEEKSDKRPNEAKKEKKKKKSQDGNHQTKSTRPPKKYKLKSKGVELESLEGNEGKRYALLIGINNYNDIAISDLEKARNDAKVMGKVLKEMGQFDKIFVMTDDVAPKSNLYPTKLNIEEKLDSILNFAKKRDLFVFFFSGHGISDYDEYGYLVTIDTIADKQFNTSLKISHIVEKLKKRRIKKSLLILDACRSIVYETKSTTQNQLKQEEFSEAESCYFLFH